MRSPLNSIRLSIACGFWALWLGSLGAQPVWVGTNAPGQTTNFTFSLNTGATNLALVVSNNASAYSHLLLARGRTPTDTDFDFIARVNGQTNQIVLEAPEFRATNYGLALRRIGRL